MASQEAWRGERVDGDLKLEVLRLLKHFLTLLCFFWRRWPWLELLPNVSSRLSSNCLSSIKYLNLLLSWHFSCHVELKLFVYISLFFTVNSCGLRAVSELYFASSVSSTVRGHNRLWLKEWIKAFHVIGCGYNELECCGSMWALVHFFWLLNNNFFLEHKMSGRSFFFSFFPHPFPPPNKWFLFFVDIQVLHVFGKDIIVKQYGSV